MFTDTITSKATQLLSNSISTNLAIQNQETFTFKALDPGSNCLPPVTWPPCATNADTSGLS